MTREKAMLELLGDNAQHYLIRGKLDISHEKFICGGIWLHVLRPAWYTFELKPLNLSRPVFVYALKKSHPNWQRDWWTEVGDARLSLWDVIPMSDLQSIPEIRTRYTKDGHVRPDWFIQDELKRITRLLLDDIAGIYKDPMKVLLDLTYTWHNWYYKELIA